jgi:hypothetical protein
MGKLGGGPWGREEGGPGTPDEPVGGKRLVQEYHQLENQDLRKRGSLV